MSSVDIQLSPYKDSTVTASLEQRIAELINEFSNENNSNTPDFVLARYLSGCLENFHTCVNMREQWHGRMAEAMEDDTEDFLRFSLGGHEELHQLNNADEVCSSNFLEENGFEQLREDITDLDNLYRCIVQYGKFYGYTTDDELVVIILSPEKDSRYLIDPTVGQVVKLMGNK